MNPQQVIDQIAAKLSVPATLIWSVLTRQAYVEGVQGIILFAVFAAGIWWVLRPWFNYCRKNEVDEMWIAWGVVAVLGGIGTLIGFFAMVDGVGYFWNPQYFALHEILKALSK